MESPMPTFPLPFRPKQDYHKGGLKFGAVRDGGGRKHAACDLIAPKGTEIYAVEDGEVVRGPYPFYHGTDAIEFKLTSSGRVVRYGEIKSAAPGVHVGTKLKEGDLIAFVGKMHSSSMLHFEMYDGSATGNLTDRSNKGFQRRKDLIDPTEYLDGCTLWNVLAARLAIEAVTAAVQGMMSAMPIRWIR
jgi:murein DD-endopeptidase MepM/ murein hydrolase activator NlpD